MAWTVIAAEAHIVHSCIDNICATNILRIVHEDLEYLAVYGRDSMANY